jgi:hypothetical protein
MVLCVCVCLAQVNGPLALATLSHQVIPTEETTHLRLKEKTKNRLTTEREKVSIFNYFFYSRRMEVKPYFYKNKRSEVIRTNKFSFFNFQANKAFQVRIVFQCINVFTD